ncbi:MAG: ATP-binding protein [Acidobacteriota bacterium]
MSPIARQLRWLIALRLVVVTSLLVSYGLLTLVPQGTIDPATVPEVPTPGGALPTEGFEPSTVQIGSAQIVPGLTARVVLGLAGATYLASLLYLLLLSLGRRYPAQAFLQLCGDLLLVTAIVYYTGGINSPFSTIYLLVIAVASFLLGRRNRFVIAVFAYVLYASLLLSLYFGWLQAVTPVTETASPSRLVYNLTVNLVAFGSVALLTSYLALRSRVTRTELELEEKLEDLADLKVVHRDVIQSINSGLITTDLEGRITSVNRTGEEILGRGEEELLREPIQSVGLVTEEQWQEALASAEAERKLRIETRLERDGEEALIGFSLSPLSDAEGVPRGHIVIFQDLTRWQELQDRVRLKDRMAAVGEMAAGLAHEVGNPLAAISGSVQMLSHKVQEGSSEGKLLDILLKESQRLDRTIKGFLRFARPKERASVHFDIAQLIEENVELLRNSPEVLAGHSLELDLQPPTAMIVADPDLISQIFWNLARNALKAMPEGGRLRVSGSLDPEHYTLRFIDTGRGMGDEERTNLFHPFKSFFDSGSGIGMAIVYRIVEEHGGDLRVDSEPGVGTSIAVELPLGGTGTQPILLENLS